MTVIRRPSKDPMALKRPSLAVSTMAVEKKIDSQSRKIKTVLFEIGCLLGRIAYKFHD